MPDERAIFHFTHGQNRYDRNNASGASRHSEPTDEKREVARGEDVHQTTVASFFGRPVVMISQDASRREITQKMKVHGIRYLPLTDASGYVTGMVSRDQILVLLSEELNDLGRAVRTAFRHDAPVPDADE